VLSHKRATGTAAGYIWLINNKADKKTYIISNNIVHKRYKKG
jgi:hypothetical protein